MKREREIRELVKKAGLQLLELRLSGGSHIRMVVRRDDGEQCVTFSALTPSDHRGAKNKLGELRRFASGMANPKRQH